MPSSRYGEADPFLTQCCTVYATDKLVNICLRSAFPRYSFLLVSSKWNGFVCLQHYNNLRVALKDGKALAVITVKCTSAILVWFFHLSRVSQQTKVCLMKC